MKQKNVTLLRPAVQADGAARNKFTKATSQCPFPPLSHIEATSWLWPALSSCLRATHDKARSHAVPTKLSMPSSVYGRNPWSSRLSRSKDVVSSSWVSSLISSSMPSPALFPCTFCISVLMSGLSRRNFKQSTCPSKHLGDDKDKSQRKMPQRALHRLSFLKQNRERHVMQTHF